MIIEFTDHDGCKVAIAADFIAAIMEPLGPLKAKGVGAVVAMKHPAGGANGFNAVEPYEDIHAAWRIAMGMKGGTQ